MLFDPTQYLTANPDVAAAVSQGVMPSAWVHYASFGFAEKRPGVCKPVSDAFERVFSHTPVLPPAHLALRVHGAADEASFRRVGRIAALELCQAMLRHTDLAAVERLLDFGCGCGRTLPYLQVLLPGRQWTGVDIDREAIEWDRENLARDNVVYETNSAEPPLRYPDGTYDVITALSVFTHLPEAMQFRWLDELRRILRPGGLCIATVQSIEPIRKYVPADKLAEFEASGFFYHAFQSTEGLPSFYQTARHTREYVEREWAKVFEIVEYVSLGMAADQDLVVCRKR